MIHISFFVCAYLSFVYQTWGEGDNHIFLGDIYFSFSFILSVIVFASFSFFVGRVSMFDIGRGQICQNCYPNAFAGFFRKGVCMSV